MRWQRWIRLSAGGWLAIVVFAAQPVVRGADDIDDRRARAFASFDAALRADRAAIEQGLRDLRAVLAARPGDALARVHLGWMLVLDAREKPMLQARDAAAQGIREMDAAVDAAPEDPEVRLVRARSDYVLPQIMAREPIAAADFAWMVAGARDAEAKGRPWPAELRREIFFHAGALALKQRRQADAVTWLEMAANIPADRPAERDVQSMLALARRDLSSQGHGENAHPDQGEAAAP